MTPGTAPSCSPTGLDCLARSARIFEDLRTGWAAQLGPARLRAPEEGLAAVTDGTLRTDLPGWLVAPPVRNT